MTNNFYHKEWYTWRDDVLRCVRFTPDHTAIAKELYAHYEDGTRDWERLGYSEKEARQKALDAMGDAEEVGRGLDTAHKPWLGWLLKATEWMLAALVLMLLGTIVFSDGAAQHLVYRINGQVEWKAPPAHADRVEMEFGTICMAAGEQGQTEEGLYYSDLYFWVEYDTPMTDGPWDMKWQMEITTDRGTVTRRTMNEDGTWPEENYFQVTGGKDRFISDSFTRYRFPVRLYTKEVPAWARVVYPFGGWEMEAQWEVKE